MFTQKFLTALVLGGCAISASAALTSYSTLPNLEAAVPADTFSNITFAQGNLNGSTTDLGVVFSSSGDLTGTTGGALGSPWPAGSAVEVQVGGDPLTIAIPVGVNAISLYIGAVDDTVSFTVHDSGGGSPDVFSGDVSSPHYLALTTNSSFTSFSITPDSTGNVELDEVEIGQPQPTPEVATLALVGTGLLLMGYMRRRRKMLQAATAEAGRVCVL